MEGKEETRKKRANKWIIMLVRTKHFKQDHPTCATQPCAIENRIAFASFCSSSTQQQVIWLISLSPLTEGVLIIEIHSWRVVSAGMETWATYGKQIYMYVVLYFIIFSPISPFLPFLPATVMIVPISPSETCLLLSLSVCCVRAHW